MVFVPPEFAVPRGLSTPLFELSVLAPRHAEADYDAVMSSRPRLQRYQGRSRRKLGANESSALDLGDTWPAATMTLDYNRTDLVEHEEEFAQRLAFAFTVFSVEEPDRCVGCARLCWTAEDQAGEDYSGRSAARRTRRAALARLRVCPL